MKVQEHGVSILLASGKGLMVGGQWTKERSRGRRIEERGLELYILTNPVPQKWELISPL